MARSSIHPPRTTLLLALASATLTAVVPLGQGNPEAARMPNPAAAGAASITTGKPVYTRYGVPPDLAREPWGDRIKNPESWNVVNDLRSLAKT